jgi:hypothetical protein
MSLYNAIHGVHPLAGPILEMLGLGPAECGRFRDAYFQELDGKVVLAIYTRNGGGNRDDYEDVTQVLRSHPNYLSDRDEPHDCTYASYFFSVPDEHKKEVEELFQKVREAGRMDWLVMPEPADRFNRFIESLKRGEGLAEAEEEDAEGRR